MMGGGACERWEVDKNKLDEIGVAPITKSWFCFHILLLNIQVIAQWYHVQFFYLKFNFVWTYLKLKFNSFVVVRVPSHTANLLNQKGMAKWAMHIYRVL